MTKREPTHGHRYLLGGGLSVLVHVALVLGFPVAHASEAAEPSAEAGLSWLEFDAEGGFTALEAAAAGTPSSAPAADRLLASAASPRVARRAAPALEGGREAHEPTRLGGQETAQETAQVEAAPDSARATGAPAASSVSGAVASASATGGSSAGSTPSATGAGPASSAGGGSASDAPASSPRLLSAGNPCAGYFPAGANAAHGRVQVEVEVGPNGRIESTRVMAEQPLGEGFGGAARACADRLLFRPAHTVQGTPTEGLARLLLRFDRT